MNFWDYLEKRSKRNSLEKLRQYYLGKHDDVEDSIRYIFQMDWDNETRLRQYTSMKKESLVFKSKAEEIEKQIKEL